jgi:hypothetical protein
MIDGFFFIISVEWVEKFDETSWLMKYHTSFMDEPSSKFSLIYFVFGSIFFNYWKVCNFYAWNLYEYFMNLFHNPLDFLNNFEHQKHNFLEKSVSQFSKQVPLVLSKPMSPSKKRLQTSIKAFKKIALLCTKEEKN